LLADSVRRSTAIKLGSLLRKSRWANSARTRLWSILFRLQDLTVLKRQRRLVRRLGPRVTVPLLDYELVLNVGDSIHDLGMFESMANGRYYEHETTLLLIENLRPGNCFIDVGANNGYYSLLASSLVGREGRVISFEPNPSSFRRLLNNLEHNKVTNVLPFNVAVSDIEGVVPLYLNVSEDGQDSMIRPSKASIPVRTVRLDDAVSGRLPDLVKMDVEGAEVMVLRGMANILESRKSLRCIVEWGRDNPTSPALWALLNEHFEVSLIDGKRRGGGSAYPRVSD